MHVYLIINHPRWKSVVVFWQFFILLPGIAFYLFSIGHLKCPHTSCLYIVCYAIHLHSALNAKQHIDNWEKNNTIFYVFSTFFSIITKNNRKTELEGPCYSFLLALHKISASELLWLSFHWFRGLIMIRAKHTMGQDLLLLFLVLWCLQGLQIIAWNIFKDENVIVSHILNQVFQICFVEQFSVLDSCKTKP